MMKPLHFRLITVFFLCLWAFGNANAQTAIENEYTKSEILPEKEALVPGETTWFALRQELRDGWHVFWINPGDAGLPLNLRWTLPKGFSAGAVQHPVPEYIPVGPLASYAHEGEPVFLVPLEVPSDAPVGSDVEIVIDASWQTCEEICVPEEGQFSFRMPVRASAPLIEENAEIFATAREKLPDNLSGSASVSPNGDRYELVVEDFSDARGQEVFFFAEPEGLIEPSAEQNAERFENNLKLSMKPGWLDRFDAQTLNGVLLVDGQGYAVSAALTAPLEIKNLAPAPTVQAAGQNFVFLLMLALLGGLILNIMPCVFPIVFIKAASFMKSAQSSPEAVRLHGLLYTAGVISMFFLLGGSLLLLRAGGEQFGWGFHLQSPIVVAFSALVLLMVGLNLAGLYSVGAGLAGTGQNLAAKDGALGAFFTGVLAVVVAAPCIGPLMSAPMGAALILPPLAAMGIFLALGLGLALPYLVLSLAPALSAYLPKPGPWMVTFKQALAFPVFAAAGYFLWVLAQQAAGSGLAIAIASAVALALAAWLFEKSKTEDRRGFVLRIVSAVITVFAIAPVANLESNMSRKTVMVGETHGAMRAVPYSAEALDQYRRDGVSVFIDFTAAWCVTCQFNKLTVFSDEELGADFAAAGNVFMVADWTVRDPEITAALEAFGASGVPLYVAYPAEKEPVIVSQPLTKNSVREAMGLTR
ncbi:protein-disulfide reductase DsbD family protein [Hyphococcus sp. DH-69]|uniref:protein-disulfide reductase DsbD family protein n=1 Tax=Hyphococcus formosus TaxID=3143534 RepID=UPI00398AA290